MLATSKFEHINIPAVNIPAIIVPAWAAEVRSTIVIKEEPWLVGPVES